MQQSCGISQRQAVVQRREDRRENAEQATPVLLCVPPRPLRPCAEADVFCAKGSECVRFAGGLWHRSRENQRRAVPQAQPKIAQRFNAGCRNANPTMSRQGRQSVLLPRTSSSVPAGTCCAPALTPALKRWAILECPSGTSLRHASFVSTKAALGVGGAHLLASAMSPLRSAGFQACCIAGFPTCEASGQTEVLVPAHVPPIWKSAIQQVWKPALRRSASGIPAGFDVNSRGCNPRNRRRAAPALKGPNRWPASPFDAYRLGDCGGGPFSGFHPELVQVAPLWGGGTP